MTKNRLSWAVAVAVSSAAGICQAQFAYIAESRSVFASSGGSPQQAEPPFAFADWTRQVSVSNTSGGSASAQQGSSFLASQMNATPSTSIRRNTSAFSPPAVNAASTFRCTIQVSYPIRFEVSGAGDQGASINVRRVSDGVMVLSLAPQTAYGQLISLMPGQYEITAELTDESSGALFSNINRSRQFTFQGRGLICRCDFDANGVVDDSDFVIFAAAYDQFTCDPAPAPCIADINQDGFVDDTDFVTFASEYDRFVCPVS